MTITVNGEPRQAPPGTTLAEVVADLVPRSEGVAAAVDETVVPRGAWAATSLRSGARVEVLTAVQGG